MNRTPIATIHEFKKHFLPHAYRQELEYAMTPTDLLEYTFRKACRAVDSDSLREAKSTIVRNLEDLDKL